MLARDLAPLRFAWFWHDHCPQFHVHHKALADHLRCAHLSPFHNTHFKQMTACIYVHPHYLHGLSRLMVQLWKSLLHVTIFLFKFFVDILQTPQLCFRPFHHYQPSQPHPLNASTSLCPQHSLQSSHFSGMLSLLPLQIKFDSCLLKPKSTCTCHLACQDIKFTESRAFLL